MENFFLDLSDTEVSCQVSVAVMAQFAFQITSPDLKLERDIYMYRAYIGLEKYKLVLDELRSTSSQELKALSLLAEYLQIIQGPSVDENKR